MVTNLSIGAAEQKIREASIEANKSAAPIQYAPLVPPSPVYTHAGHAAGYGYPRRLDIRGGIYHVTDGNSTVMDALRYDARRPEQVSCTAFAGGNGELGYDVPENCRPWTTGRWNDETVTLEIIGHDEWTAAQWYARPRQLDAIVAFTVDIGRRYDIPAVWLDADEWGAGAGLEGVRPFVAGVNRGWSDHYTVGRSAIALGGSPAKWTHVCVGAALRQIIRNELLPEAARILAGTPPPIPPEDDMAKANTALIRFEGIADVFSTSAETQETLRRKGLEGVAPLVVKGDVAALQAAVGYPLSPTKDGS